MRRRLDLDAIEDRLSAPYPMDGTDLLREIRRLQAARARTATRLRDTRQLVSLHKARGEALDEMLNDAERALDTHRTASPSTVQDVKPPAAVVAESVAVPVCQHEDTRWNDTNTYLVCQDCGRIFRKGICIRCGEAAVSEESFSCGRPCRD